MSERLFANSTFNARETLVTMGKSAQITKLLHEIVGGNHTVIDELFPLLYHELRGLARNRLRVERQNHTLNPTALVHEAYFKLVDQSNVNWQNRAHFLALAAQAMRRILINYAEMRRAVKRGGGLAAVTFDEELFVPETRSEMLIDLDEALSRLSKLDERQGKVVEMKFFGGLTDEEVGEALNMSVPTIRRDWRLAKAWLLKELSDEEGSSGPE